jgi:hypothetical protein
MPYVVKLIDDMELLQSRHGKSRLPKAVHIIVFVVTLNIPFANLVNIMDTAIDWILVNSASLRDVRNLGISVHIISSKYNMSIEKLKTILGSWRTLPKQSG